jgi:hypothetical protein
VTGWNPLLVRLIREQGAAALRMATHLR